MSFASVAIVRRYAVSSPLLAHYQPWEKVPIIGTEGGICVQRFKITNSAKYKLRKNIIKIK